MGTSLQDFGAGGGRPPDIRKFLQGDCSGDTLVLLGYLGDETQDWADPWQIPPQGCQPYGGNKYKAIHYKAVGVPASECSNFDGGPR